MGYLRAVNLRGVLAIAITSSVAAGYSSQSVCGVTGCVPAALPGEAA